MTKLTFLMKGIQLVFVIHVMVFASHVSKCGVTHVTLVDSLRVSTAEMVAQGLRLREALLADVTAVGMTLVQVSVIVCVAVEFQMFLQFETFVEGLTTHLAHWADLSCVFPHVIQQIFFLPKDVTAGVALVLHPAGVNRNMFLQTVEA